MDFTLPSWMDEEEHAAMTRARSFYRLFMTMTPYVAFGIVRWTWKTFPDELGVGDTMRIRLPQRFVP